MPDWTKRNFEDITDRSPAGVPMRWLFSRNEVGSKQVGVSRFSYEPGARMPFGHRHTVQEEVYVVVAGSGARNSRTRSSRSACGTYCAWRRR